MSELFEINAVARRLRVYVERSEKLRPEAARLLEEALLRGEIERGDVARITGLPERSARRVLKEVIDSGLLASAMPVVRFCAFRPMRSRLCFRACFPKPE